MSTRTDRRWDDAEPEPDDYGQKFRPKVRDGKRQKNSNSTRKNRIDNIELADRLGDHDPMFSDPFFTEK